MSETKTIERLDELTGPQLAWLNGRIGGEPVKKFTSRSIGVKRIEKTLADKGQRFVNVRVTENGESGFELTAKTEIATTAKPNGKDDDKLEIPASLRVTPEDSKRRKQVARLAGKAAKQQKDKTVAKAIEKAKNKKRGIRSEANAKVLAMMERKGGATKTQILEATGWPRVWSGTMNKVIQRAGKIMVREKNKAGESVWFARDES